MSKIKNKHSKNDNSLLKNKTPKTKRNKTGDGEINKYFSSACPETNSEAYSSDSETEITLTGGQNEVTLDKVYKMIQEMNEKMIDKKQLDTLVQSMSLKIDNLESEVNNLKKKNKEIAKDRDDLKNQVVSLETRVNSIEKQNLKSNSSQMKSLQEENKYLKKTNEIQKMRQERLESSLEELENKSRRENLVILGLNKGHQNVAEDVKAFFNDLLGMNVMIEQAFRLGNGDSAPIKVQIKKEEERTRVLRNCYKLKGKKISVLPDLCLRTREKRKLLQIRRLEEKKNNNDSKCLLRGDKLFINDKVFIVNSSNEIVETTPATETLLNRQIGVEARHQPTNY